MSGREPSGSAISAARASEGIASQGDQAQRDQPPSNKAQDNETQDIEAEGDETQDDGSAATDSAEVGAGRRSARGSLNRNRILEAALALMEREGLHELSMRRLGRELGVEAMALYRYTPSREILIDGVVELVVDELYNDPEVPLRPLEGWQDYVIRVAHGVRRMALAHPQVFPLVATRPPAAPWVRPPLRSLRWIESFLEGLEAEGFTDELAVYAYRAFTSFLLGHLLLEVGNLGVNTSPLDDDGEAAAHPLDSLEGFPHLARLQVQLEEDHSAAEFDESLTSLLGRLDAARRGVTDQRTKLTDPEATADHPAPPADAGSGRTQRPTG